MSRKAKRIVDKQFSKTTWPNDEVIEHSMTSVENVAAQIVRQSRPRKSFMDSEPRDHVFTVYIVEEMENGRTGYHTDLLAYHRNLDDARDYVDRIDESDIEASDPVP